jgi:hypothetical protein
MHTTPLTTNTPGLSSVRGDSAYRGPCRVLGAHITRVTRGETEEILCGEYCPTGGICLLRQAMLGETPTQGLTVGSSEGALGGTRCVMLTA